jgi:Ca2+:H+ antiporter
VYAPALAFVALLIGWGKSLGGLTVAVVAVLLAAAVLAAVHHAEVVAHKVGEPFGSLILAVAVTVIEVALIITLMISGPAKTQSIARDTVFAAIMITCNGIVGVCILIGALRRGRTVFNSEGTGAALATICTITTLSLVLPSFTQGVPGPQFTPAQLTFAGIASIALYGTFVTVQTVRHRGDFLPVPLYDDDSAVDDAALGEDSALGDDSALEEHHERPTNRATTISLALLLLALVAVVGDAKLVSPTLESAVAEAGMPQPVVGVIIAMLVLAPETVTAIRAARRDHMQTSLNLALGSAIASIGLTIPAIAVASFWLEGPLLLGLDAVQMVLFLLTAVVGVLTVVPGRATLMQAGVHLSIFAAFLFLAMYP